MAKNITSVKTIIMSNGLKIPVLGLGTSGVPHDKIDRAVGTALMAGYREFDCAYYYGNEGRVGKALTKSMKELGIDREELFITSKVWFTHLHPDMVEKSCRQSLKDLQLKYLDLLLVHWPVAFKPCDTGFRIQDSITKYTVDSIPLTDTWKAMEKLVDDGLVKSIGLSNFNKRQLDEILEHARIKPVNLQIEMHANFPNTKMAEYAQSKGLVVTAYSPLSSMAKFQEKGNALTESWVQRIAEAHNKTPAQILLRYLVQRGVTVIPKSQTPERIVQNAQIFDFNLTDDEMHTLNTSGTNERKFTLPG
ncbi:unnamed protein product [Calicophoron daubneyi]